MISTAIEKNNGYVYVYNEKNNLMFTLFGKLHGFTSTTVSIYKNGYVYVYNEKGNQIGSNYVGWLKNITLWNAG